MDYSLAFTALLNGMPGFGQMPASKGHELTSQLVVAWRNRKVQGISFKDFAGQWIAARS
jgi:hypothetical protein